MIELPELCECRWSKGCSQPISLAGEAMDLCTYHGKLAAGLLACPSKGCALHAGHRGEHSVLSPRRGVLASDEISDEQRELRSTLRQLGMPDRLVKRALTRQIAFTAERRQRPPP